MTYDEACRDAATRQGLNPITDALTAANIPHTVDQTGGFCMVVRVPIADSEQWYGITADDDGYLLCSYGPEEDYCEEIEAWYDLTLPEVLATIR